MSILGKIVLTGLVALALRIAAVAPAHAAYPVAPDVVVFCEPTLRRAVTDVGVLWQSQTGVPVRVFTSPTSALLEQIAHHARDDVVIGEGDEAAGTATRRGLIKPETLQHLWRNRLVTAARHEASNAAAVDAPNKLADIAGKAPIAIVDPWASSAGADSEKILRSVGLWQAVHGNSVGVVGTEDAAFLLAEGKVRLAIVYATDVADNPDFTIADHLPDGSYPPIIYWAALTEHSLSPNAAKFVAFLHEPQAQQKLRARDLEVLP